MTIKDTFKNLIIENSIIRTINDYILLHYHFKDLHKEVINKKQFDTIFIISQRYALKRYKRTIKILNEN